MGDKLTVVCADWRPLPAQYALRVRALPHPRARPHRP